MDELLTRINRLARLFLILDLFAGLLANQSKSFNRWMNCGGTKKKRQPIF
jgi:hypothetical protein